MCFSFQELIFNPHPYCNCHKWLWLSTTKSFPVEIPPYSFHHPPRPTYNISMRKSFLVGYHTDISAIRGHAQNILDWLMNFNIAQQTSPEKVFARFFSTFWWHLCSIFVIDLRHYLIQLILKCLYIWHAIYCYIAFTRNKKNILFISCSIIIKGL